MNSQPRGSPTAFTVRRATADDVDAFTRQRVALYQELHALPDGPPSEELARQTRDAFRSGLERGTCVVWLGCELGGAPAGALAGSCALIFVERMPSPRNPSTLEGYIGHVYVAPAWRRRGVGSAIVRAAMDEVRARSLPRIRLHASDVGLELYERLGFRVRTNEMEWRAD